jgi:hypothetical protein
MGPRDRWLQPASLHLPFSGSLCKHHPGGLELSNIDQIGVPANELLSDVLRAAHRDREALSAYQASLKECLNGFNSIYGAALTSGQAKVANTHFEKLVAIAGPSGGPPGTR